MSLTDLIADWLSRIPAPANEPCSLGDRRSAAQVRRLRQPSMSASNRGGGFRAGALARRHRDCSLGHLSCSKRFIDHCSRSEAA